MDRNAYYKGLLSVITECHAVAAGLVGALSRVKEGLEAELKQGELRAPKSFLDARRKPKSRIDGDTELRDFILLRITRMTFKEVVAEVAATFPPHRRVSCSSLHRWWHRRGKFLATPTAKS